MLDSIRDGLLEQSAFTKCFHQNDMEPDSATKLGYVATIIGSCKLLLCIYREIYDKRTFNFVGRKINIDSKKACCKQIIGFIIKKYSFLYPTADCVGDGVSFIISLYTVTRSSF